MNHQPTVLVLLGGPDAEREVSIMSGSQVAQALRDSGRYAVIEKIIDAPTAAELAAMGGDVVFPVLHGRWGEGGPLQQLLEQIGKPYVGSQPIPAALAMDKMKTKSLLIKHGVPTPESQLIEPTSKLDLQPPLVLKPVDDGSSVDLRICRTPPEMEAARQELHPKRGRLLAERYINGREITVGIVLDQPLPLIDIIPSQAVEFYDYQAKYHRDDTKYVLDPALPPGVAEHCRRIAMTAFHEVGCRDVARVDVMVDDRGPWFLEINTMPGFTTHSLVPMAAAHAGLPMPALCGRLVEAAVARGKVPAASAG